MAKEYPKIKLVENLRFGSDIEYFVARKSDGQIVSAEGFIEGTKQNPKNFDPRSKWWATQLDNVLAEGNVPPALDGYELSGYIQHLRTHMDKILKPHGLITKALASARIPKKYLQTENAKTFGCEPSFNAWTHQVEEVTPKEEDLRSAGFHIHVGYSNPTKEINVLIARMLDLCVGVPAVILSEKNERTKLGYGRAGNYRHQKHGVEYRVLPSSLAEDQKDLNWVAHAVYYAVFYNVSSRPFGDLLQNAAFLKKNGDAIQEAINDHNQSLAGKLVYNAHYNHGINIFQPEALRGLMRSEVLRGLMR